MLVRKLKEDFPHFKITFAPVVNSLLHDGGSMGGFSYKKLYNEIGDMIDWFNTQCYFAFSYQTYHSIIQNGYPSDKIVMGMESGQFTQKTFQNALNEVSKIKKNYPLMSGVYDWEYLDAPPDKNDPSQWARLMKKL